MQPEVVAICSAISALQVERKLAISLEVKLVNTIVAHVAKALGAPQDEDEDERAKRFARATGIVAKAMAGKPLDAGDAELGEAFSRNMAMTNAALSPVRARRDEVVRDMEALAKQLPVSHFLDEVKGFNALGLAVIIGEAGNLSNYPTVRKLWRRLGFGMAPGHEAHAYSTWRSRKPADGPLSSEDWMKAGYSPKRLGQIYGVVTSPLFFAKGKNKYGEVYAKRRERTAVTHPEWTKGHSDMDARRVMTKALIADLWSAWRGSSQSLVYDPADLWPSPPTLIAAE